MFRQAIRRVMSAEISTKIEAVPTVRIDDEGPGFFLFSNLS